MEDIGKITKESLAQAMEVVQDSLFSPDSVFRYEHNMSLDMAWELLCAFGDLEDSNDDFAEFVFHYNTDRGY